MRAIVVLALLAAAAPAEVEAPLGPYARPGVPVLLTSDTPVEVRYDGWTARVGAATWIHPPQLPCVVRDTDGRDLLRLEPVPEGERLVGVIGDPPADLGEGVRAVAFRPEVLDYGHWRVLDVFDHVLLTAPVRGDEPWLVAVETWVLGGGSLIGALTLPRGGGLGSVRERLADAPARIVPFPGNVRPDLYAAVAPVEARSAPLRAARWIVFGAALASLVQIVLALSGLLSRRALLAGLAAVALAAALIGALRTRADYTAVARGEIEVRYRRAGVERRRTYRVFRYVGPGAATPSKDMGTPILFRASRDPWFDAELRPGMIRIFLTEEVGRVEGPGLQADSASPAPPFLDRERPAGGGWRIGWDAGRAPCADPRAYPLLRRLDAVQQD